MAQKTKNLNVIYQLIKSSFLERVRTYRYMVTLILTLIFAYLCVPPRDAVYISIGIGGYGGYYNSAFLGIMGAVESTVFLSLFGFYVIKNSIKMDLANNTGELISATPVKKWQLTLGKTISNALILYSIVFVVAIGMIPMLYLRGDNTSLYLWDIISPFIFSTLPLITLVAALAVLFEVIPFLNKGLGNVLYVFLWIVMLVASIETQTIYDPAGISLILDDLVVQAKLQVPELSRNFVVGGLPEDVSNGLLWFEAIDWGRTFLLFRLFWVGLAVAVSFIAALFFTRYNPEKISHSTKTGEQKSNKERKKLNKPQTESKPKDNPIQFGNPPKPIKTMFTQENFPPQNPFRLFVQMFRSEFSLNFRHLSLKFYLIPLGLNIAILFAPFEISRSILLPIAAFVPILLWSKLGTLDKQFNVSEILGSTPNPVRNHFLLTWMTGVSLSFIMFFGGILRFLLSNQLENALGLIVGCLFIPSLAIALGIWTGSGKGFEFLYTILWYIGPMSRAAILDYLGILTESAEMNLWVFYLVGTGFLVIMGFLGKKLKYQR